MSAAAIAFYGIAIFILVTGLLAVTTRKIFRSAIWLLFSLVGIAALYFWMDVQFIAAVQIVVYVGGIVVLIIFSIFLTQAAGNQMAAPPLRRKIFALLATVLGFGFVANLLRQFDTIEQGSAPLQLSVGSIGENMLSMNGQGYVLPFELVSILLLAAMIGCIVIAMKRPANTNKEEIP